MLELKTDFEDRLQTIEVLSIRSCVNITSLVRLIQ